MNTTFIHPDLRFNSYGSYLRRRFGCRVSKVNVDGGFTCPNRDGTRGVGGCIYCDNRSFSPGAIQETVPIEQQLQAGMDYHRTRLGSEKFIVYFQKYSNTYAPVDRLRELYCRALDHPDVMGISVGTRPDCLSDEALSLLEEIARERYVCLELGLQSVDEEVLRWLNRCHDFAEYCAALERAAGRGFDICTHLIHGFPGETRDAFLKAAELISSLPVDSLKIHQLHAVRGTVLAEMHSRGEFVPLTHEQYVADVCDFLEMLPPRITIQRLYGSAPLAIRVAPTWDLKNNRMWYSIVHELHRRGTWQGYSLLPEARRASGFL
jgi:radical SAM protein (TIGR01212 family)